jgi:ankyrin repeat protein
MSAGAKLELRNDNGETPILAAAKNLNLLAVKKLIALGADKNVTDNNGLGVFELLAKNADEETLKDLSALGVQKTPELERVVLNQ